MAATLEEIKTRFAQLVPGVNQAAEVCESDASAPEEVTGRMRDFVERFEQGRKWIQHSMDEESVRQCIDELAEKSAGARRACERSAASREVKNALAMAHEQIADLQRLIH